MVSPALSGVASAVLVSVRSAQLTTMSVVGTRVVAVSPEPALVESKLAWLDTVPQVAVEVVEVMWTLTEPPEAARSSGPQLRVLVVVPVMAQLEAVVAPAVVSTHQLRPVVGRVSAMVTPWATPAPELVTVIA